MKSKSLTQADAAQPWYAQGLNFSCTQCGNCCTGGPGYVWISDQEVDRLAEHLKMTRAATIKKFCRTINGRLSLQEERDESGQYPCVFLQADATGKRGCTIYPVRPLQCRTWPFWEGNLSAEKNWKLAGAKCPGLNKGKHYSLPQIHALRDATEWPATSKTPGSKR